MKGNFTKESTSTTGAVLTLTLVEIAGWTRLSAVSSIAVGDTFEYTIFNGDNKEVGIGTKQASNTFDRTTPIATLVAGVYDDSSPVKITLVDDSEVLVTLSAESTMDINDTVFVNSIHRADSSILGNDTSTHINLGKNSTTGEAGQNRVGITISGGEVQLATKNYSTIGGGFGCEATNSFATVSGGANVNASGLYSSGIGGDNNLSSASYSSTLGGRGCTAAHTHSIAALGASQSRANFDFVLGATDSATASVANNTIRFQATGGNILIDGAVSSPEADIAECLEYMDGNPSDANLDGMFVSLVEGKLILGGTNIKGIISAAPSLISNAAPNGWQGTYLKNKHKKVLKTDYTLVEWVDEWGDEQFVYESANNTLYDEYPQPTAVNGKLSSKAPIGNLKKTTVSVPTINPAFDIAQVDSYVSRVNRKEWGVTGVNGQIIVNTSEPITGWFVDVDIDNPGFAKNGSTYDVIKVIDDFTALVYFK